VPTSDLSQGGDPLWTRDVLNLGVKPDILVAAAAERFRKAGGIVLDCTSASGAVVHPDGVSMAVSGGQLDGDDPERKDVTCKLLLDSMGHSSPIVRQARCAPTVDCLALLVAFICVSLSP
jgi:lycopene cyclase CruP